jgi:choline kinase
MTHTQPEILVILAAGLGSRLQSDGGLPKPLLPVAGRALILRVLDRFHEAGIDEAVIVLGHRADEIRDATAASTPMAKTHFVVNERYRMANGLSVLAAKEKVGRRSFFLSMSDHIFETELIASLAGAPLPENGLLLAVDRKLSTIYDMDDATKVRTEDGRIVEISKNLENFDAVDSGLFSCTPALMDAIQQFSDSREDGDCSLSEGVWTLAQKGLARVHDIGEALWQDVDTPECALHAEKLFAR